MGELDDVLPKVGLDGLDAGRLERVVELDLLRRHRLALHGHADALVAAEAQDDLARFVPRRRPVDVAAQPLDVVGELAGNESAPEGKAPRFRHLPELVEQCIEDRLFVGEVVMKDEMTAFLKAANARGCSIQIGIDMLYEQIPAYLEFFGFPTTTPDNLRVLAQISY